MCCETSTCPAAFCGTPIFKTYGGPFPGIGSHSVNVYKQRSMHRLNIFYAARKVQSDSRVHGISMQTPRVVIIGGGAAGHMAAIACARRSQRDVLITIIESSKTVLDKVRISGGGRCNITSALDAEHDRSFVGHYPRGRQEMLSVIAAFSSTNTISFFEEEGVRLKTEPTGKVFPISDSSESVINALGTAARKSGVHVLTCTRVMDLIMKRAPENVSENDNTLQTFQLKLSNGQDLEANYVVVATGSARLPWTWASAMGHRVLGGVPSLFTFKIQPWKWGELAGISVDDVQMSLSVDAQTKRRVVGLSQRGPILITHWGFSGPVVLTLSAFGARVLYDRKYNMECVIDWIPSMSAHEKEKAIEELRKTQRQKQVDTSCPFWRHIPKRLWRVLVEEALELGDGRGTKVIWGSLTTKDVKTLVSRLHECRIQIRGRGQFKEEFVTAGGVSVSDIDTKTFESKLVKGLYFAGETLNVDGCTGGYNLQFAWSSGFIAGKAIADRIKKSVDCGQFCR